MSSHVISMFFWGVQVIQQCIVDVCSTSLIFLRAILGAASVRMTERDINFLILLLTHAHTTQHAKWYETETERERESNSSKDKVPSEGAQCVYGCVWVCVPMAIIHTHEINTT